MTEQSTSFNQSEAGKLPRRSINKRGDAALDTDDWIQIQKYGHKGILTTDQESKMETLTMTQSTHVAPQSPGVRLRGIRRELLEKQIYQKISEQVQAERSPATPETDYSTTAQRDFCVRGFIPHRPPATQVHDYKNDQAITFWSENYQRVQGVTAAPNLKTPFKKSALFSTPISERLDEIELPPDD